MIFLSDLVKLHHTTNNGRLESKGNILPLAICNSERESIQFHLESKQFDRGKDQRNQEACLCPNLSDNLCSSFCKNLINVNFKFSCSYSLVSDNVFNTYLLSTA